MNKLILNFLVILTLMAFPKLVFSQDKEVEPVIISIVPDSLFIKYEYTQTVFISVTIASTFGKDPTEKAIQELKKLIIETCKLNKMSGFILDQMVFVKPFEEGKLIGYGTMIRPKIKQPK